MELTIVLLSLVTLAALGLVFYLAKRLAITSQHILVQSGEAMRHALAINSDCREFERIRFNRDVGRPVVNTASKVDLFRPDPQIQVDGIIPVSENGALTEGYSRFERGE